ncbi:hypothetical protein F0562_035248 [Nyssa sinensis]|uniref:Glycosyltransferase n=1 Tax=Nyssa sinensis TaxID=561372 RepID=A0A5J5AA94_9ASTE|nr:hypothetical protein F0562_035248 [Nyssa sinensis]
MEREREGVPICLYSSKITHKLDAEAGHGSWKVLAASMDNRSILLVTLPWQGHINPTLQFAKRLIRMGLKVTFVTSASALRHMAETTPFQEGLTFAPISDGYDDGIKIDDDIGRFTSELKIHGSKAVTELVTARANEGRPIMHVVYTILLPWVAQVAHRLHIPSTILWIQPATILDICYHYFNGYDDIIRNNANDLSFSIELPGLPVFTIRDLPSFLLPSTQNLALPVFKEHFETLDAETNPKVLINSFDELEPEALRAIDKINMIAVGPLIPSVFLDGKDTSDASSGIDLFQKSNEYVEWLNSKPESSVIYISFGSLSMLSKQQMEEMARGLLESQRPFLWVNRAMKNGEKQEDKISCKEELEHQGMIVSWCSQLEVLSHPSLGCFVTHCGWNSSLESLVCGVPMVAFPQWADQGTNAKVIEDVWKTGVRVKANEQGLVSGDEIKSCIEMVMGGGERGEEMRRNAMNWKDLAREAVKEGGSTDMNLKAFVDEIGDCL